VNMIIESRHVFFEDVFPYKREKNKASGKRKHETTFRDEGPNEPTVNAEIKGVRDRESLNPLVQIS